MNTITKENLAQMLNADMPYQQLKISGNVKIDDPGKVIPGVKLTMYNEKGKLIWMNGQVAIMNVGRALATPEKFQAYEKLSKTYVDEDYAFVNELLGVNFINYSSLEKLFLGKVFLPVDLSESDIQITDDSIVIKSLKPLSIEHKGKTYSYLTQLLFDRDLNLQVVQIQDAENQRDLVINYEERENYEGMNLPKLVKINIKSTKPKTITLKYNNFDNQKMDINFKIPSGYSKRIID